MSERPVSAPRRAAVAFIFVTVVLDVLAFGIIIPVLPKLVEDFLGGNTARAAEIYGLFGTVWALMQFFFSPVLGSLSDRYGRRVVILLSNFGLGIDYVFMALAPTLGWLFVGRLISGVTGASFTTAGAYIADVTPPEKRAASYGMLGAAFGVGFVLGPALGGVLGGINPRYPFWAAAALTLINACYGMFVLPESLAPEKRRAFSWQRANPVGALRLLRSHPELLGLASVNFLYYLAHQVLQSTLVLYASYRYGWQEQTMGLMLALIGLLSIAVQGGLVRVIIPRIGERRALLTGLICGMVGFLSFGLAPTGRLFVLVTPVFSIMGLYGPSAQGLMTRRVSPTEQGQLSGANSSVMGITGMIGPTLFTVTFATFIGSRASWHLPGAPFFLASGMMLAAAVIAFSVTRGTPATAHADAAARA